MEGVGVVRWKDRWSRTPALTVEARTPEKGLGLKLHSDREGLQGVGVMTTAQLRPPLRWWEKLLPAENLNPATTAASARAVSFPLAFLGGKEKWSSPHYSTSALDFQVR